MRHDGWLDVNIAYQSRLAACADRVERLQLLAVSPAFSFWADIRSELSEAADEIRALRQRIAALEGEDA